METAEVNLGERTDSTLVSHVTDKQPKLVLERSQMTSGSAFDSSQCDIVVTLQGVMGSSSMVDPEDSLSKYSPTLLLWLSLLVEPGLFYIWIVLLTIQNADQEWIHPVLLGDGVHWAGIMPTSLGWALLVKAATFVVLSFIWLSKEATLLKVWHFLAKIFVGLSVIQALSKVLFCLPLISKYKAESAAVTSLELQYSRIPWSAYNLLMSCVCVAMCVFAIYVSSRQVWILDNQRPENGGFG